MALLCSSFGGPLLAAVIVALVTRDPAYVAFVAVFSPISSLLAFAFAALALLACAVPSKMLVKRGRAPLARWWAIVPVAISGIPLVVGATRLDVQMFCGRVLAFALAVWLLEASRRSAGTRRPRAAADR